MQILKNTYFLAFSILVLILFSYTYMHPIYNWDLLLYTSAVVSWDQLNPELVHDQTYELAQQSVPHEAYKVLITGKYEEESYRNPAVFQSLKPLTKTRPLYVFLLVLLNKLGLNPTWGTALLSSIGCFIICLISFAWLARYYSGIQAFLLSLVVIFVGHFFILARMATPEALSASAMLAAVYVLIEKKQYVFALTLFSVAIALRHDNIIFPVVFLSPLLFAKREEYQISKAALIMGLGALILVFVLILVTAVDDPVRNLSSQVFLGAFAHGDNTYGAAINRFILDVKAVPSHILFFLIPMAGYVVLGKISQKAYRFKLFFWSTFCALMLRILLFPSIEIRFYIFYVTLICLLFLLEFGRMTNAKSR
jgi:hypothetical protein